nr:serine/threonine-protein kinase SRPK-like [Tanacetum cinerariifolium]
MSLESFREMLHICPSTPIDTEKPLLKDPDGKDVDCKKQTVMATSSTEAEYVAAASGCAQVLWIQNQLLDYGSVMTSAVICLSTDRKFNFSKYIFKSLVRNVDSSSKFYMYPRFLQFIIQNQLGDLSSHTTKYISPALTQKVFANTRRVEKGFSGVETLLFEGMLVVGENVEEGIVAEQVQDDADAAAIEEDVQEQSIPSPTPPPQPPQDLPSTSSVKQLEKDNKVKVLKLRRLKKVRTSQRINTSDDTIMKDVSNQGRMIDELDRDEGVALTAKKEEERKTKEVKNSAGDNQVKGKQAEIYQIDMDHPSKVLSMQEDEPAEVEEVVEVVTTAKLITEVVVAASKSVSAASTTIPAAEPQVPAAKPTVVPVRVVVASTRRRKRVVIRDLKEESTAIIPTDTKSKDKGKEKMVEEPKPMKKKQQIEEKKRRAIESINETPAQKAAKRRKLNKEVAELNKHLEIVPDEDDDVFTEATPLARKVPVVDYSIIFLNNKPHYKIIKADGTHRLYISFLTLLKNFDRDDLKSLWSIIALGRRYSREFCNRHAEQDTIELADFLVLILDFVPDKRPTPTQCLNHPWLIGGPSQDLTLAVNSTPHANDDKTLKKNKEKDEREALEVGVGNIAIGGASKSPSKQAC